MIAELKAIETAAVSLKTAGEIVNALVSLGIKAEVRVKIIELQTVILAAQSGAMSAQSAQMALLQRVVDLEGELARLENWEIKKTRYEWKTHDPGVVVPELKVEFVEAGEPAHAICPACYQRGQASIFQPTTELRKAYRVHVCLACKADLAFSYVPPEPSPDVIRGYEGAKRRFSDG